MESVIWSEPLTNWIITNSNLTALSNIKQLKGATSSCLYLLSDTLGNQVVIRFYTNKEWLKNEPDLAEHEASSLQTANSSRINTPRLLAYSYNKEISPFPAVLMSYLKGEVNLPKENKNHWLKELAKLLAEFHTTKIAEPFPWTYSPYNKIKSLSIPQWSQYKTEFGEAIQFAKNYKPFSNIGFIHRDFHPVNVLWERGEATGLVDWPNACWGPKEVDVGHCRVNLALLYGVETAELFLHHYLEESKFQIHDQAYWDLITLFDFLPNPGVYEPWLDFGMDQLTDHMIKGRYDAYLVSIYNTLTKNY